MKKLALSQKIKNLVVTRGTHGALVYNKNKNTFSSCEAFADSAVDKIGAGDAMLSIIALFFKRGFYINVASSVNWKPSGQTVSS